MTVDHAQDLAIVAEEADVDVLRLHHGPVVASEAKAVAVSRSRKPSKLLCLLVLARLSGPAKNLAVGAATKANVSSLPQFLLVVLTVFCPTIVTAKTIAHAMSLAPLSLVWRPTVSSMALVPSHVDEVKALMAEVVRNLAEASVI